MENPLRAGSLILSIFLCGTAYAEEISPTDEETLAMGRNQEGERWYGVHVLGKKVGWQKDVWHAGEDSVCNAIESSLRLAYLGQQASISVEETTCYSTTPPFAVTSYESVRDDDGKKTTIKGSRKDDAFMYVIDTGTQKREMEAPTGADRLLYALPWAGITRMKTGDTVQTSTYDELTGESRWQKVTLKSRERRNLLGKDTDVYLVSMQDETGLKLDALLSETGIVLEGSLGPNLRIVLEDKDTAMRQDEGLPDLFYSSVVPATGAISYSKVGRIERLKLKLKAGQAIDLPAHPRQRVVQQDDQSMVIEVAACPGPVGAMPVARAAPEKPQAAPGADADKPDLRKYTACHADLPCDMKEHIDLAASIAGKDVPPLRRAQALSKWVHANFRYQLGAGGGTADQIIKEKKGDCTEFSKALVLLLRSAGLPARTISGIALADDSPAGFAYHAWAEVWIDGKGWVALDPTWGTFPVDAPHIVFDTEGGRHMAVHFGELSIEILDVGYADEKKGISCD